MEIHCLQLNVNIVSSDAMTCSLKDGDNYSYLSLYCDDGLVYKGRSEYLSDVVERHEAQLKKVLKSALKGNIKRDDSISVVLIDDFPFMSKEDYSSIIRLYYDDQDVQVRSFSTVAPEAVKLITDGSYCQAASKSAYALMIIFPTNRKEFYTVSGDEESSNLMELLPVLDGMRKLRNEKDVQICTDSRYVIRGLTQWMHFWCHNDWQTAKGEVVCNIDYWQELYDVCKGKTLYIKWIKGHSGDNYQECCHRLAQYAAGF